MGSLLQRSLLLFPQSRSTTGHRATRCAHLLALWCTRWWWWRWWHRHWRWWWGWSYWQLYVREHELCVLWCATLILWWWRWWWWLGLGWWWRWHWSLWRRFIHERAFGFRFFFCFYWNSFVWHGCWPTVLTMSVCFVLVKFCSSSFALSSLSTNGATDFLSDFFLLFWWVESFVCTLQAVSQLFYEDSFYFIGSFFEFLGDFLLEESLDGFPSFAFSGGWSFI